MERTDIRYALTEVAEDKDLLNRCNEDQKKYSLLRRTWRLVLSMKRITIIGETGRNLSTRLTEHKRATRNGDVNNHIAEHHLQTKPQMDWDSATCTTYSTDYYRRLTLENWFTNLEQTPLNRSQQLITSAVQTTHWRDQAQLTTRERLEN